MHLTHAMAGDKFVCQAPRLSISNPIVEKNFESQFRNSLRTSTSTRPKGMVIIDGRLLSLPAVRSTQWGAAIFAMRHRLPRLFFAVRKNGVDAVVFVRLPILLNCWK